MKDRGDLAMAETARRMLEANQVAVWAAEIDEGRPPRMYGDRMMWRLLGVEGKDLTPEGLYHAWYDNINPTYRKLVDESVNRMIGGKPAEVVYPWVHPFLGEIWIRCCGQRDNGYVGGVRLEGLHRDISNLIQFRQGGYRPEGEGLVSDFEQRRPATTSHEWQSDESLELWREIADTFPNMLFFKDVDNGWKYCYSNAQHHDFVGMDPTGKTDVETFGEESGSKWHAEDVQIFESGKHFNDFGSYCSFCEGDRFYNMRKYPLVTKSGHRYIIGCGADITDLYLSQVRSQCLLSVQESLARAVDHASYIRQTFGALLKTVEWIPRIFYTSAEDDGLSICLRSDGAGGVIDAVDEEFNLARSQAWRRYLGSVEKDEVRLCTDIANIVPEAKGLGLHAVLSFGVYHQNRCLGQVAVFTNRRGPTSGYADMLADLVRGVIIYARRRWDAQEAIRELERQKEEIAASRLAEAQEAERAKSLFLASMSHEIRTPLNAVIGLSQELQNDDLSVAERKEHLRSISTASRALLDLINDVLDISKLESGHFELVEAETGAASHTRACGSIFTDVAARRGLSFEVSVPADDLVVRIDPHRVRQILLNLIGNAVKFTKQGGVTLVCDFRPKDDRRGELSFTVKDTGIGISRDDQSRVFGMFEQASGLRGTRVANSGTGLGLALCQRLAKVMGGEIRLVSELGKGSAFTLVLPDVGYRRRTAIEIAAAQEAALSRKPSVNLKGKVLIVDDVPLNLRVLGIMLKRAGVDFVSAGDVSSALKILELDRDVSVVLTDLWMPDMSGEAFAKCLRSDPRFASLRIAAVTADADAVGSFDTTCFDAILSKPVTTTSLLAFLAEKC